MGAVIPPTPVAPGAPTGLVAIGGAGFVLLNWVAPTDVGSPAFTRYDVYRGTSSGVYGSPIDDVAAGTLTYNDTTVIAGTPYFYVIKAVNTAGSSPASNERTATATPGPQAPTAPLSLAATSGSNFVVLTWVAPVNPGVPAFTRYDIFRGATAGSISTTPIGNVAAGTLTYNDTTAVNGNSYVYIVKAVNTVGASPASNIAQANLIPPGAPTALTAVSHHGYINLSWTAPSSGGVSNYLVFRGTTAGGESATPIATVVVGTSYQDDGVVVGTPYYYKVKANNSFGQSAFSNEATGTAIANTVPSAPQSLTATAGSGKVTLAWQAPADSGGSAILSYQVYRSTGGGAATQIGQVGGSVLTYVDTSVTAGTTYTYYVKAVNEIGAGAQSTSQSATPTTDDILLYAGIGIVIAIAVVLVAVLFVLRKRKGKK
jgi:fibronectin type 3 domain-containing protein